MNTMSATIRPGVCVCVVLLLLLTPRLTPRPGGGGGAGSFGLVSAAPLCSAHSGCHVVSLSDLFDRVLQHSARTHGVSNDLHQHFERYFLPSRNQIGRVGRTCHTSSIVTPTGKDNAQRMAGEELTAVILKLLLAWRDPLWHLQRSMSSNHDFNNYSSSPALEVSGLLHELRTGVEKVAEKMQLLGLTSNSVSGLSSPESRLSSDGVGGGVGVAVGDGVGRWRLMSDHDLLYCFRRDSNKVQNFLKILKCRIVPQNGC